MKRVGFIIFGVIVLGVVLLLVRKNEPPELAFTKVKRQTIVSTLPTNGKVEPLQWQAVHAETAGVITSMLVHEGQGISKGAVIAIIAQPGSQEDLHSSEARAAQFRGDLETLHKGGKSSTVSDLEADLAKAKFDRDIAQREYTSLKRLLDQQAATNVEVLMAKGRLDAAELSIRNITARRQALVGATDITVGQSRLAEAEALVSSARAKLETGVVRSPIAGTVYSLPARAGTYVDTGALIANVGNLDQLRVRVYVDEPELGRIRTGLPVKITWDGLAGRSWNGSVERLPTEIVALGSRQVGEVWVTIQNLEHDLVVGSTVNAEVRAATAENALVIPKAVIRRDRGPNAGVFVLRHDHLMWQPVTVGTASISDTAITSGLSEGELVLLPTDTVVKEGDRVRAVVP